MNQAFPHIPDHIDIVFDLAGSISETAHSITSALQQSDVVIVPIHDEIKSIMGGIGTIKEVLPFNNNIVVVATKLEKTKREQWQTCRSYQHIATELQSHF